jgi:LysM repeat protein
MLISYSHEGKFMRKVNQRSRRLRHLNAGTKHESYLSQIKSFVNSIYHPSPKTEFSINHQENRYDDYNFAYQKSDRKNLFGYNNLKKYLTHFGIVTVCGFTIISNTCFGNNCPDYYSQAKIAMASASNNSDIVEINSNSDHSADLTSDGQINQIASTINTYTKADSKKIQIDQAIKQNEDDAVQDMAIIQNAYLDKTNSPVTEGSADITRKHVITHLVKDDETLWTIADKYGLSTDTIKWSNGMDDSGIVIGGQELYILPMDGIYYTVQDGDTVSSIAEKYKSDQSEIEKWNDFSTEGLSLGRRIILPGGTVPPPPKPVVQPTTNYSSSSNNNSYYNPEPNYNSSSGGSGQFGWPTSGLAISQYFGSTSFNPWHTGLDLDSRSGWDIFASDGGTVVKAEWGWGGGYGNHVMIDHGNGYQTLYGHMTDFGVSVGQSVSKGQRIGTMGSTGWSTGPHLHFEIRYNGSFLNPLSYL